MLPIRRILVPTDFGDCSTPAVRLAAELADKFGAEFILLHVVQDLALAMPDAVMPTPLPGPDLTQLSDAAKIGLTNLIERENLARLKPRVEIRIGSPVSEIVAAAGDLKADLLCVGTHGRTGLAHLILGSQAERIIREAPCPVLTVKPRHIRIDLGLCRLRRSATPQAAKNHAVPSSARIVAARFASATLSNVA